MNTSGNESLVEALRSLEAEALGSHRPKADDPKALEELRIQYLGRKDGRVSRILRGLGSLAPEERPAVGAEANRVKDALQEALEARKACPRSAGVGQDALEISTSPCPDDGEWRGGRHPVTQVVDEIWGIFRSMGFTRARGPEVETDWYNFVALNTPLDHPAVDEADTLYLADSLLRTHTSPVQMRTMEQHEPPIRIIAPGMVYRRDTPDATHTPAFLQIEGLVVDEGITFVDFKATLAEFARRYWGSGHAGALPAFVLPVHRAQRRGGREARHHPRGRHHRGDGLAGDHGRRDGGPRGPGERRLRLRALHRLRLRHGAGADRRPQVRHSRTSGCSSRTTSASSASSPSHERFLSLAPGPAARIGALAGGGGREPGAPRRPRGGGASPGLGPGGPPGGPSGGVGGTPSVRTSLTVCRVVTGEETFQVVCGAPNVRPNGKYPFRAGGSSPSQWCRHRSAGDPGGGLERDALLRSRAWPGSRRLRPHDPPGGSHSRVSRLAQALGLDDWRLDVEVTANRGDLLSHLGIARELAPSGLLRRRTCRRSLVVHLRA